ncbi:hypothetical protein Tco_1214822 [Tanacetum coccineum]
MFTETHDAEWSMNAPPSSSTSSSNFEFQQMAAALEDKMTLTFRNEMNEMKNMIKSYPDPFRLKHVASRWTRFRMNAKGYPPVVVLFFDGPLPYAPPYVNFQTLSRIMKPMMTKDKVQPESSQSTANVQPRVDHGKGKDKLKDNEKGLNEKEKDDECMKRNVIDDSTNPDFGTCSKRFIVNITLADALILMPKYQKMLKSLLSNKEKLNEMANTPWLKCKKALADLGASINLMPFSVYTKLGLPTLQSTQMTLELANCSFYVPKGIARDVLVPDDEEIISIEVSRQISPKVNSEPSIESPISSSPSIFSSEASEIASGVLLEVFAMKNCSLLTYISYPERDDMTPDDVIKFLLYGDPTSDPTESKVEEFINENTPDMSKEFVLDDMSFSPKELNWESLPKDDFDNDDDLFEMDSNNDEWKELCHGVDLSE